MANIFKDFKVPGHILNVPGIFLDPTKGITKTFDEPTYLTFRVEFLPMNTNMESTNYDRMPMPLFSLSDEDIDVRNNYSAISYLKDSNEVGRAQMMASFINGWNIVQNNFQWYFQGISNLNDLFAVDPKRGIRISTEGKVTMSMLEGLDWRITHLLNLYRKIAWDDVYQRWMLPDMMRYFAMNIYITEFRSFHQSSYTEQAALGSGPELSGEMVLKVMGDVMPTWVLHCERCEFDITSLNSWITDLKVNEETMTEVTFDIKVGQLTDEYVNPILDYWYWDQDLNGQNRTADDPSGVLRTSYKNRQIQFLNQETVAGGPHTENHPFIETGGSGASNISNAQKAMQGPSADLNPVDPVQPSTWLGNTLTLGKALVKNLVNTQVNKAQVTKIPGLGFSFNEALSAIQSKNIFAVFALAREAITQSVAKTTPSQELDHKIIEQGLKAFLRGIAHSQATTPPTQELVKAAEQILNDRGQWQKLMDYSLATDLVSRETGEVNITNALKNPNTERDIAKIETGGFLSFATDANGNTLVGSPIIEAIPSSLATSGHINVGPKPSVVPSEATVGALQGNTHLSSAPKSEATIGTIQK